MIWSAVLPYNNFKFDTRLNTSNSQAHFNTRVLCVTLKFFSCKWILGTTRNETLERPVRKKRRGLTITNMCRRFSNFNFFLQKTLTKSHAGIATYVSLSFLNVLLDAPLWKMRLKMAQKGKNLELSPGPIHHKPWLFISFKMGRKASFN